MKGVVGYLKSEDEGKVRLVLNDVKAMDESPSSDWQHIDLFTSNTYDFESLRNLNLSQEQFAEIGENIILRILALGGQLK